MTLTELIESAVSAAEFHANKAAALNAGKFLVGNYFHKLFWVIEAWPHSESSQQR